MSPAVTKAGGIASEVVSWSHEHVTKNLAVSKTKGRAFYYCQLVPTTKPKTVGAGVWSLYARDVLC
jgi:hypothetical protein